MDTPQWICKLLVIVFLLIFIYCMSWVIFKIDIVIEFIKDMVKRRNK